LERTATTPKLKVDDKAAIDVVKLNLVDLVGPAIAVIEICPLFGFFEHAFAFS
jgi:hypothetical protein